MAAASAVAIVVKVNAALVPAPAANVWVASEAKKYCKFVNGGVARKLHDHVAGLEGEHALSMPPPLPNIEYSVPDIPQLEPPSEQAQFALDVVGQTPHDAKPP